MKYYQNFRILKIAKSLNYEKFEKKQKKIDYRDDIVNYLYGPIIFNGKDFRKEVNSIKKIKNSRKPTDNIVYTDGYSFYTGVYQLNIYNIIEVQ